MNKPTSIVFGVVGALCFLASALRPELARDAVYARWQYRPADSTHDDVIDTLEREGVEKFADSFRALKAGIDGKRRVARRRRGRDRADATGCRAPPARGGSCRAEGHGASTRSMKPTIRSRASSSAGTGPRG